MQTIVRRSSSQPWRRRLNPFAFHHLTHDTIYTLQPLYIQLDQMCIDALLKEQESVAHCIVHSTTWIIIGRCSHASGPFIVQRASLDEISKDFIEFLSNPAYFARAASFEVTRAE